MKNEFFDRGKTDASGGMYVLKHKDLDVAMVEIDRFSGKIEYVLDIYLPEELPAGCQADLRELAEWWESRAIPDSRRGIQQALHYLDEKSNLTLMLSACGLSLTDHYWMQQIGEELYWKDLNFFENDFSDELGSLLTDSGKVDLDSHISRFSPSSSVNGEMKKKWVIENGVRYLMKVSANYYGQQAVNEVIASRIHERLGWSNYVPYRMGQVVIEGRKVPCSLNPLFTSLELEFVSAYQLVKDVKVPNDTSEYEEVIHQAVFYGIDEDVVRRHLEYTILTDFILSNTDRHYNNFGFLYDAKKKKLVDMAPIFDTGNSLFYDQDIIPKENRLLEIRVASFKKREVSMLEYVSNPQLADCAKLEGFPEETAEMLMKYTDMPAERADRIAETVRQKIEYLKLFQQGKKIWKRENYW